MQDYLLIPQVLAVAFVVWGLIEAAKPAIKDFKNPKRIYLVVSSVMSPSLTAVFLAKFMKFAWIDWGWMFPLVFIAANLYQPGFKKLKAKFIQKAAV